MRSHTVYKGIVIKVTQEHIVLMCEDGVFKNVPRTSTDVPPIGQPYVYKEKGGFPFSGLHYIAMASILFLSIIGYTIFSSNMEEEAAYVVAIDINPSIEIYTDDRLAIIEVKALNNDGKKVIDSISDNIKKLDPFVKEMMEQSINQNYLKQDENGAVAISIVPLKEDSKSIDRRIQDVVKTSLQAKGVHAEIMVVNETKRNLEKAKEVNLSINKFRLYKELTSKGIDASVDVIRDQSIVQTQSLLKEKTEKPGLKKDSERSEVESPLENEDNEPHPNQNKEETSKKTSDKKRDKKTNESQTKAEEQQKSDKAKEPQHNKRSEDKKKEEDEEETEATEEEEKQSKSDEENEEESEEPESDKDSEEENEGPESDQDSEEENEEPESDEDSEQKEREKPELDVNSDTGRIEDDGEE